MNDNPYSNDMSRSGPAGMSGFMLGALVGAGVALLFAPAAGHDTRRRVGDTVRKLGSAARDRMEEGKEHAKGMFEGARQGFEGGRQEARNEPKGTENQFGQGRREPVPSTGTNPGQTGNRPGTPGRP